MKKLSCAFIVSLLALCLAGTAFAAAPGQKIKSFDLLVDYSMSMGWKYKKTGNQRIALAQELLTKINALIPGEDYTAGMHLFAPKLAPREFGAYGRADMQQAIDALAANYVRDRSVLSAGTGLDGLGSQYADLPRDGAVVLFTDGAYGQGRNSINETRVFYQTQPGMCLHIVSFANEPEEKAIVDGMAAVNPCTVYVEAADLLASDEAVQDFVDRVWGAPVAPQKEYQKVVMSANDVHFAFDSAQIHESQMKVADTILADLQQDDDLKVRIDGYTCNVGAPAYNVGLSQRRADAVKSYMVSKGIASSRIITQGHGEVEPIADNSTLVGRKMNRRVEFTFFK
ncbi:OmpA family protein [Desulfovibrio sp. OttesenSCG-928-C06]|nr:OmpA family protein [Desulfovibrio sp. OttesenSCG-928-C06]